MDHWDRLIDGLRRGDASVMADFVRDYRPALERIAAGAIPRCMRGRVGPESVAQSVCRTFLRRMEVDPFEVGDADALWRLLCAIALNKARAKVRFHLRERRGAARDVPLDRAAEVADGRPTPEDAAAFEETLRQVLDDLDEEERAMVELRLGGSTQEEIAARLGCSERTVRRLLAGLETRLERRLTG